ncbi:MAG: hypothetical protein EBT86_03420 [Actinobacteria bacterium]|nr:hypothetical protein [Actinomycetota bacterium]
MAVVDKQKVDLLYKKLFGLSKTDFNTLKGASNETIPSPSLLRGDKIWTQANSIIKAPASPNIVQSVVEYRTMELVPDTTTTPINNIYPTYVAKATISGSEVKYENWISPEFGPGYLIEVFIGNPASAGTKKIFDAGINDKGAYYFDYMSGVLNFTNYLDNGDNSNVIPDDLSAGDKIYVRGYRYIGFVGLSDQADGKFGNLQLLNNTIRAINKDQEGDPITGDVILKPQLDGYARVQSSRFTQHLSDDGLSEFNTGFGKTTLLVSATTTNGTWKELTLDGSDTLIDTNRFELENNHSYKVKVEINSKLIGGNESASWNLEFLATRGANASTTSIIGNTLTEKVSGSSTTSITILTTNAGSFTVGGIYRIKQKGDTVWESIASNPNMDFEVGTVFTATGPGSGTGIAEQYLDAATILNYSWSVKAEVGTTDGTPTGTPNGVIRILVKGPDKINIGDSDKIIKWFAAINIVDIFQA